MRKSIFIKGLFLITLFLTCHCYVSAQSNLIQGIVTNEQGETIPGASVVEKGTTNGTATDIDGKYSIKVSTNAILVFSSIAYLNKEVAVDNKSAINVILSSEISSLSEVVVVGYGSQKKETVVGAVSSIKGTDLLKSPATNLSNAIAGRMAGVMTMQASGEPGADGSTIRIRGSNTLGNNDPLIVIDGVAARSGGLDRLDPNDIESMSVLKDASAAIYGARAANGVILITTKKGYVGKPSVTYSFNQGWSQPTTTPKMANAAQYASMINEHVYNKTLRNPKFGEANKEYKPVYSDEAISMYANGSDPWRYPDTDWFKETLKTWSPRNQHNLSLEGGTEKVNYFGSAGYKYEDAFYRNSATNFRQYNLRLNLDATINPWVKVGMGIMVRQENRNYPTQSAGDILWFVARGRPTDPAYWPNGLPGPAQEYGRNPVVAVTDQTGKNQDKQYYIQTNGKLEITQPWIEGLKFTGTVSYDKFIKNTKKFFHPWSLYTWDKTSVDVNGTPALQEVISYPDYADPSLNMSSEDQYNLVLGGILSYDKKVGQHTINIVAGTEKDQSDNMYFDAFRRYYLSKAVETFQAGGDQEKTNGSGDWKQNWKRARLNYFGRVAYNFSEKYLAEFVWRYDASYMFPKDNRYGFFPGVLLGYRISEEQFWKDHLSFLSYFKLRASWGQMGNDQVWFEEKLQEFQYESNFYYEWGYIVDGKDKKGLRISTFPNKDITWERANNYNVGIEGRLFKNRLSFEVDYFSNHRSKILWKRNASIPESAGLTLPAENIGKVTNRGFDFKLNWQDQQGDFKYNVSLSGGYAKNKITYWDEAAGAPEWQKSTGHPMQTDNYFVFDGAFRNWDEINDPNRPTYSITNDAGLQPGDMKFKDLNGDGKITDDDKKRFDKSQQPTFTGGLNLYAQYKNFDLTVLFQGAAGAWTRFFTESGDIGNYTERTYNEHWSAENPTGDYPRVHNREDFYWGGGTAKNNTYWMNKTDYVRLKNLELGYNFPQKIMGKTQFFTHARLYVNALNLATFTNTKDLDPESTSSAGTNYPQARVINIGVSVTF